MRLAIAFLGLLTLLFAAPLGAESIMERLITPGPLASAHAKLESKCENCHTSFKKEAQNTKCTACHRDIAADVASGKGYHGKSSSARSASCKSCHSDHQGRSFALVKLNRASFNHALTDYALVGAHRQVTCVQCHGKNYNYRGISTSCAACHKADDPHLGKLGGNCQDCHSVDGWKQIKPFNHARTGFALTGAHRSKTCLSCHTGQRWKGLPASCISCHASDDTHHGSRGTNCAGCHSTSAWQTVSFDHSTTGFPLIGGHAAASCTACHGKGNTIKKPSHSCTNCHAKDDIHKGQVGTDCASCHNARSWQQIAFDHTKSTQFPLRGAHRKSTCSACHQAKLQLLKPETSCVSCHSKDDVHHGGNGQDCERCHGVDDWKAVSFNHDTMTRFALKGKHAQAKCEACHVEPADKVKLSLDCASCHAADDVHKASLGPNCGRCHDSNDWKSEIRFDHDLTHFPLLGKHSELQCTDCHSDKRFAAKGVTCASCHQDDHHKGGLGTPALCRDCHNTRDWKSWNFDHDSATKYPLTGQHKGLVCASCHSRPGDPAALGTACVDCHRRNDIHRGGFGEDCARCHVTSSFRQIVMPGSQN